MSHLTILESENKCLKGQLFGLKDDYHTLSVAFAAREKRIAELESQVTHWKSNHDEQLKVKRQLLDRPDLQDRAASIKKLEAENNKLKCQVLIEQAKNKDLAYLRGRVIELEHLRVTAQEFLKNSLFAPKDFFRLKDALKACDSINSPPKHTVPPHNHPIHSPPQESEHPQTHEG